MTKPKKKPKGEVRMLPGAHRPDGALSWLHQVLGNGDKPPGIIVAAIDKDGSVDVRVFGCAKRNSLAFAGAILTHHAVSGD